MNRTPQSVFRDHLGQVAMLFLLQAALASSSYSEPTKAASSAELPRPALTLDDSSLLQGQGEAMRSMQNRFFKSLESALAACHQAAGKPPVSANDMKECQANAFYETPTYRRMTEMFDVEIEAQTIGGVYTEVIRPKGGIEPGNRGRLLLDLHGGGFQSGARYLGRMEAIPIASLGKLTVISVDYRQAPEYRFPAASEDVEIVYREMLKKYKPSSIGIYGCSAGGLLTAEVVAWLQKDKLPRPGAVGMFCEGAAYWTEGDSGQIAPAFSLWSAEDKGARNPYFNGVDQSDPLAFPVRSTAVLAKFPPALLISSTRDVALSSVAHTHTQLRAQGVDAELGIWEGVGHGFLLDPDLPQSQEAYRVIVKFFLKNLGT